MIKHKSRETKTERKVRRLREHNIDKTLTKYYHFDFEKVSKEKAKELDEEVKRIMITYANDYSHIHKSVDFFKSDRYQY